MRPSGFDWGALNDLLAARLDAPRRFHLEDNLRCPSRIAAVIERASQWYVHLDKSRRPTKQRHQQGGQHVDAHLLQVVADVPTAGGLLERLDDVEGLVVITVADEKPAWVPERLRDMVLTPAHAKGLEYQSVCVLDPGRMLARLEAANGPMTTGTSQALREQEHRTAIDQLRVALSRATETLAFVDVAGDDDAHALSAELLEDAAPYHPDDLVEHFADDAPPDERVQARTKDARGLIDRAPGRAWQRACQAIRLLGDPQLPNGVSDENVRIEARTTLLATAARLLVDGVPAAVRRHEVVNMAGEAIMLLGASDHYAQALHALDAWRQAPQSAPFALLDATLALDSDGSWLRQALPPVAQRLRDAVEAFAGQPAEAAAYAGDVANWLQSDRLRGRRRGDCPGAALPGRRCPDRCRGNVGRCADPGSRRAAGPRAPGAAARSAGSSGRGRGNIRGGRHACRNPSNASVCTRSRPANTSLTASDIGGCRPRLAARRGSWRSSPRRRCTTGPPAGNCTIGSSAARPPTTTSSISSTPTPRSSRAGCPDPSHRISRTAAACPAHRAGRRGPAVAPPPAESEGQPQRSDVAVRLPAR